MPYRALKESAFKKTGNQLLAPRKGHISMLPLGLRSYIKNHPDEYSSYVRERKAELQLLKSVKQNVAKEESAKVAARPSPKILSVN